MYKVFALIISVTLGYWVEAKDLREGDVFLGANGELSTLVDIERVVFPDGIKVYNFTVDGNHDYFVIAATDEYGQTCVLVHNATPACRGGTSFKARVNKDVFPDHAGIIGTKGGISININPTNLPSGTKKFTLIDLDSLPVGLTSIQQGRPGHYLVVPEFPMPVGQYQTLLNQIVPLQIIGLHR